MKKSTMIVGAALPLVVAGALFARGSSPDRSAETYRLATVERADLRSTISATGTLHAVTTVQVGTQVSGQVAAIYVDFNDRVQEGQLLARIDPVLAEQAVREAETSLARSRAEHDRAQADFDRAEQLHERQVVTDAELTDARYQLHVAEANLGSAEISVERARRNLAYTEIHAPIDGIVVERNVDVGQTVAASVSTPQLFLIAEDLSRMQILASVDESDISLVQNGQPVDFGVQGYPDEVFTGEVEQVRLQSTTQENVVTYTAVVAVENPDGRLLPGMTATVELVTGTAADALVVPNAALRFRATEAMVAAASEGGGERGGTTVEGRETPSGGAPNADAATLWTLQDGRAVPTTVTTGLTDGQSTVVVTLGGSGLEPGTRVITGTTSSSSADEASSPFQQSGGDAGPPRPGGF